MATSSFRKSIAANSSWLKGIRLVSLVEIVLCALALGLCIPLAVLTSSLTEISLPFLFIGCGAHMIYVVCIFVAASRDWSWKLSAIVVLSQLNLLIYAWSDGPATELIMVVYAVLAALTIIAALARWKRIRLEITRLTASSTRDDFRWLITAAPLRARISARAQLGSVLQQHQSSSF